MSLLSTDGPSLAPPDPPGPPPATTAHSTSWLRTLVTALGLSILVGVIVLAFSWPALTSTPTDLRIDVVGHGSQVAQVERALIERSDGAITVDRVDDRASAVQAIRSREIDGAIVLDATAAAPREVLTATAAGPQIAQALTGMVAEPDTTIPVTDVAPLSTADPHGAGLSTTMTPLVLAGMISGIAISRVIRGGGRRRAAALGVYAAAAGLVLAAVLQGLFGVLQHDFLLNALAIALGIGAISGTIIGLSGLVGVAGMGLGAAFMLLVANPLSGAAVAPGLIAAPWGAVGQFLPPGATGTLLRDLSYFPDASTGRGWWVVTIWFGAALLLTLIGRFVRRRTALGTARTR